MLLNYKDLTLRDAVTADARLLAAWWNDGAVMAHAVFPNRTGRRQTRSQGGSKRTPMRTGG